MTRNGIQWLLVGIIYLLLMLDWVARVNAWYWNYQWFDLVTHSIGGLWIGLATLWSIYLSGYLTRHAWSPRQAFAMVLIGVLGLGVAWEGYEYVVQVASNLPFDSAYPLDTSLDLIMDTLGAMVAYVFFMRFVKREIPASAQADVSLYENVA